MFFVKKRRELNQSRQIPLLLAGQGLSQGLHKLILCPGSESRSKMCLPECVKMGFKQWSLKSLVLFMQLKLDNSFIVTNKLKMIILWIEVFSGPIKLIYIHFPQHTTWFPSKCACQIVILQFVPERNLLDPALCEGLALTAMTQEWNR